MCIDVIVTARRGANLPAKPFHSIAKYLLIHLLIFKNNLRSAQPIFIEGLYSNGFNGCMESTPGDGRVTRNKINE